LLGKVVLLRLIEISSSVGARSSLGG